jgi:hypothetical protein
MPRVGRLSIIGSSREKPTVLRLGGMAAGVFCAGHERPRPGAVVCVAERSNHGIRGCYVLSGLRSPRRPREFPEMRISHLVAWRALFAAMSD